MSAREDGFHELSLPDLERRIANMIRYGRVMTVDLPNKRVRVKSGNLESGWLPWPAGRAGAGKRRWDPPEMGEQVVMLAPTGDLAQAVILPGLYQTAHDAPSASADEDLVQYGDGSVIGYNRGSHTLTVNLGDSSLVMNRSQAVLTVGASVLTITGSGTTLATPQLTVNAPTSTFTGLVQCASLQMTGVGGGAATITGNVTINGNVATTGTLTNNGTNVGSGHRHSGVQTGGSNTGTPT